MKRVLFLTGYLLCTTLSVFAEKNDDTAEIADGAGFLPNSRLTLELNNTQSGIQIDGIIEEAWKEARAFNHFTEYAPSENRAPLANTEGYVTHDRDYLYVAFQCYDPDISKLRATLTDRDHLYDDDWVCLSIDPHGNHQSAYQFYANARGVQGDRLWQINMLGEDNSYDVVWDCEAQIYDEYWVVEMRIPFENLRFPEGEKQEWSVHFTRNFPRDNPYRFSWMPISQNNNSFMGQAGGLNFELPKRERKQRIFEVLPYTVATQTGVLNEDATSGQYKKWQHEKTQTRAGFGVKYGLSSNLTSEFTFNPDFSQIESDAGQITVNNPFALFYAERRPFFQEGNEIYRIDQASPGIAVDQFVNLFYSRSINDPLVAGKITGKAGKVAVGYTSALDKATPFIIPFEGQSAVVASERRSVSNIVRAKMDVGEGSTLGFFTSNRTLQSGGGNTVGAVDATFRLTEKLMLTTIAGITRTVEPEDEELSMMIPDKHFTAFNKSYTAAFDGEQFTGYLLRGKLQRNARHWTGAICLQDFSPGFRADNGFISTVGYRNMEGTTAYAFRWDQHPLLTSMTPRVSTWRKVNYNGQVIDTGLRPNMIIQLRNQITVFLSAFLYNREYLYGKQFGDARSYWIFVGSNHSRWLNLQGFLRWGEEINRLGVEGSTSNPFEIVPTLSGNFGVTLKPTAKLNYEIQLRTYQLYRSFYSNTIRSQRIFRNAFSYQFNSKSFLRIIGEYNIMDMADPNTGVLNNFEFFSLEPQFSYKLNAFSVFYVGAQLGAKNATYLDWEQMNWNRETVYMKLQYLFGL